MLLIMPLGMSKTVINVARWPGMRSTPGVCHTPYSILHALSSKLYGPQYLVHGQVPFNKFVRADKR